MANLGRLLQAVGSGASDFAERRGARQEQARQRTLEEAMRQQQAEDRQRKLTLEEKLQRQADEDRTYALSQRPAQERLLEARIAEMQSQGEARQAASQPKPPVRRATEWNNKAEFMREGAESAEKTLRGYSAPAESVVRKIPFFGNYGLSEKDQVAQQAAETMHDAYLRITTGATINKDELARAARQYMPEPGDSPGVLRAKAERRRQVIRAIQNASAPARDPMAVQDDVRALPNPDYD